MNKTIKSITVLVSICAIIAILLGITNAITAPIIAENQAAKENEALLEVLPNGKDFKKVDLSKYENLPKTLKEAYSEAGGGYVVKLETSGYASGLVIMCGINADLTVSGAVCISSNETLGYEKTYGENFAGRDIETVGEVDTISNATKTTEAYRSAVKDAIGTAMILSGGSFDSRTEEEILNDNLSAALPDANGEFEKLFLLKEISVADAYYAAKNGSGYVALIGEQFIASDAEGNFAEGTPEGLSEELKAQLSVTTTDIDTSAYTDVDNALTAVLSAKITDDGTYILEMKAAGYGINGGSKYHPASGEYIKLKVAITKDGKIVDCVTTYQAESVGIGDVCASEKFYGQFDGKTRDDYTEVDGISGATITTDGYMKAILRAFIAVEIFEGGNE